MSGNVVTINRKDVVSMKWNNKHYEYHTLNAIYYGSSNSKEETELQAGMGFFEVKKKQHHKYEVH